jgi:hypothetical protein
MGGNDSPENIVELTAEEHFVAHQLLVRLNPGHFGILHAAMAMAKNTTGRRAYGWLRRRFAAALRGRPHSPEAVEKTAAAHRGRPLSLEHRAKIAAAALGRTPSPAARLKMSMAHCGKPHSPEHRAKIGAAQRGAKRPPHTLEHREKIRVAMCGKQNRLGRRSSPETCAKLSAALIGNKRSLGNTNFLGRKHTPETREKMSVAQHARHQRERELQVAT